MTTTNGAPRGVSKRRELRVAAAQPPCRPGDLGANLRAHVEAVRQAQAQLVVFPELSLTGYLMEVAPLAPEDAVLQPLIAACAETATTALVGAPVDDGAGGKQIAVLAVDGRRARVAYRKVFLGGQERVHFTPGPGTRTVEVQGWRIGLGVCKDTGTGDHIAAVAGLGVDLYAAGLVHAPEELAEQDARGLRIAAACGVPVAFASAAGDVGDGYRVTAGCSTVWAKDGSVLARAGADAGQVALTLLGV